MKAQTTGTAKPNLYGHTAITAATSTVPWRNIGLEKHEEGLELPHPGSVEAQAMILFGGSTWRTPGTAAQPAPLSGFLSSIWVLHYKVNTTAPLSQIGHPDPTDRGLR